MVNYLTYFSKAYRMHKLVADQKVLLNTITNSHNSNLTNIVLPCFKDTNLLPSMLADFIMLSCRTLFHIKVVMFWYSLPFQSQCLSAKLSLLHGSFFWLVHMKTF